MDRNPPERLSRRQFLTGGLGVITVPVWRDGQPNIQTENKMDGNPSDNLSSADDSDDSSGEAAKNDAVFVNQVGYRPDDDKIAIVRSDVLQFDLIDIETDSVVYTGTLSERFTDPSSGDTVRWADFSDVTTSGTYRIVTSDGRATSPEFRIASDIWIPTMQNLCQQYTLRRSNTSLADSQTGLDIQPGHPQDTDARLYFSDEFYDKGDSLDVSGGWYDAGDYGKYVPTAAVTVAQLLLAYELSPEAFTRSDLQFLDGINEFSRSNLPNLLTEVKFELEWLERMQRPDGAVYHKVAGTKWPDTVAPAKDTQQRYVFGLSTFGTALYAGAMAMAGRVYVPYDAEFASRLVRNAEQAFEFLENHKEPFFRHDDGQDAGSGSYRKETDSEERFWAAAELLRTTDDSRYAEYIEQECEEQLTARPTPIVWNDARLLGQWAFQAASEAHSPRRETVRDTLLAEADKLAANIEKDGYRVSLQPHEYIWGSTRIAIAKGNILCFAYEIEPREGYKTTALDQIHYVLGRTPTGFSYVTAAGNRTPENPHCRLTDRKDIDIPGQVVGGPNQNADDPVLAELHQSGETAPAKCYVDSNESYGSNEPAIDYAAPLVLAIASIL